MSDAKKQGQTAKVDRRRFIAGTAAAGAVAMTGIRAPAVLAQSSKPLKIGMLNSFSKIYAVLGQNNVDGMNLWLEQNGATIAGRKVEIIKEDDELNPQVGLQKLKKLVESDEIDILLGPQGSNVAMAAVDYVKANKVFWICSGAGTDALTWNRIPYMFRTTCSSWQHSFAIGEWFYKNVATEAVVAASDFAGGRDTIASFKRAYAKAGGKAIKEIYPPLGTADFSAYLADIQSVGAKGIFCFFAGVDAVRFVKQYDEYGLKAKTRLCSAGFMVEADTLPAQGDAALGIVSSLHYTDTLDNPANKKFVESYRAKFNVYPSVYSEYGYVTMQVISDAVKVVGGDTSNKDKLAEAVVAVKFDAPRGPFSFDPVTHNVIENVYVREVTKIDGRLTNKVIATFEALKDPGVKEA